jgi:hypothetical protein
MKVLLGWTGIDCLPALHLVLLLLVWVLNSSLGLLLLWSSSSFRICYAAAVGAIYGVALFVLVTAPFFFLLRQVCFLSLLSFG